MPDRRRLIQPQPATRSLLMRVLRAFAQLRRHQLRVDAQAPRRQLARQPRRPPRLRVRDIPVQGRATQGVRVMRVDDGEHVAAIERLAEPADESGIAEGAPIEAVDDGDTIPNESMEGDEDEGEDDGDEAPDDDAGDD